MADGDNTATGAVDPNSLAALLQQTMQPNPSVQQEDSPITGQLQAPPPTQQPQVSSTPPNTPPRMGGMPLLAQYIQGMIKGGNQGGIGASGYPQQPQSRGDMTLNFLGEFLGNMAQGLSNAGHGPGANLRGAGAAMQAPYQRSLQNFQVQQGAQEQQARIAQQGAQTGLTTAQTGLVGQQTQESQIQTQLLQNRLKAMQGGGASDPIASLGALTGDEQAVVQAAQKEAALKGDATPLLNAAEKIANMRAVSQRMGGSPSYKPDASSSTGVSKVMYDKTGKILGVEKDVIVPGMLGKTTSKTKFVQGVDGTWQEVPYTESTRPNIPGQGGGGGGGVGAAKPVMGADNQPLATPASAQARSRAAAADSVNQLIPRIRELVQQHKDELGPIMGRGQQIRLRVGAAGGPWVNELNGALTSLYSFAGTMHGWRALQVEEAFRKQYGGLEQNPDNFMGSLDAMKNTADAVIKSGTTRIGGPAAKSTKVDDLVRKHGGTL